MPIYEYHCKPCDHDFETLTRSSSDAVHCPICGNLEVDKQVSVPAASHSVRSLSSRVCSDSTVPKFSGGGQCGGGGCGCH